jgi:hypothetical protein
VFTYRFIKRLLTMSFALCIPVVVLRVNVEKFMPSPPPLGARVRDVSLVSSHWGTDSWTVIVVPIWPCWAPALPASNVLALIATIPTIAVIRFIIFIADSFSLRTPNLGGLMDLKPITYGVPALYVTVKVAL